MPTFIEFCEVDSRRDENSDVIFEDRDGFKLPRSIEDDGLGFESSIKKLSLLIAI
jgi:hypothetical protein